MSNGQELIIIRGIDAMVWRILINPMKGHETTMSAQDWRFGDDWPGRRCGAMTRTGASCLKPALSGRARCQLHGGRAGAPSEERNGNYRNGRHTKAAMKARREAIARVRALIVLGRAIDIFR